MNTFKNFVESNSLDTINVTSEQIQDAEKALNLSFDADYLDYLHICGQLEYEYLEFYGLGVSSNSHVNMVKCYQELSIESSYPKSSIPILDLGDGHYALYSLVDKTVIEWCKEGIVKILEQGLEKYLMTTLENV